MVGPPHRRELCVFSDAPELEPNMSAVEGPEREHVIRRVGALYGLKHTHRHFPAGNPVSIETADFARLSGNVYFAGLKTDGCRYLLFLHMYEGEPRAVMINRAMRVWEAEVWAPLSYFEQETLLDGELTWERIGQGLRQLYLVFDAVQIRTSLRHQLYRERLHAVHRHLLSDLPAGLSCDSDRVNELIMDEDKIFLASTDMRMSPKGFVEVEQLRELWGNRSQVAHRNDGLILVANEPLQCGTDRSCFKWKPPEGISLDVVVERGDRVPRIRDRNRLVAFQSVRVNGRTYAVKLEDNPLLEFARCGQRGGPAAGGRMVLECLCRCEEHTVVLFPVKQRTDKTSANDLGTATATLRNVLEAIDIETLWRAAVRGRPGGDAVAGSPRARLAAPGRPEKKRSQSDSEPAAPRPEDVRASGNGSEDGGAAADAKAEHPRRVSPRRRSARLRGGPAEEAPAPERGVPGA